MKKLIFLSILMLMFGTLTIFAQQGNRGGARNAGNRGSGANSQRTRGQSNQKRTNGKRKGKSALKGLGLSSDQKQQIKDIKSAGKENGADKSTVAGQVRSVLTEEQAAKYDARLEKKKKKRERKKAKRERRKKRSEANQNNEGTTDPEQGT